MRFLRINSLWLLCIASEKSDGMRWTSIYANITVNALALIDDSQRFTHRDGSLRTGSDTLLAADTTDITILTCAGTRPLILTAHGDCSCDRHQLDQFLRANFHALSATMTRCSIDMTDAVLDRDGTERAYCYTVTKTKASESTGVRSAQEAAGRMTTGRAKIDITLAGLFAGSLTTGYRDLLLRNRSFGSKDRCDLTRTIHTTDRA